MIATLAAYNETRAYILAVKNGDSYRELQSRFNIPFYVLRDIVAMRYEHVSDNTLILARLRLGLPDLPPLECPDCGSVHTGRCHGQPVASVVVLAPGDVVQRGGAGHEAKPKPRKPSKALRTKPDTHSRLTLLKEEGQTWDNLLNEMARVYEEHKATTKKP